MKTVHADPDVYGPRNRMEKMIGYRAPQWREEVYEEMVHLDNKSRLRMGRAAIKYFMVLYDLIKCNADSKVKGLEIKKRKLEQDSALPRSARLHRLCVKAAVLKCKFYIAVKRHLLCLFIFLFSINLVKRHSIIPSIFLILFFHDETLYIKVSELILKILILDLRLLNITTNKCSLSCP